MSAVKVLNLKQINKRLRRVHRDIGDPTKFYKMTIIAIDRWIQKNFEEEGAMAYPGAGWKPLAPTTVWARQKGWGDYVAQPDPKILQNKGQLKTRWKMNWNKKQGAIWSGVEYGEFHDQGEPVRRGKKSGNIPQRKIIPTEKMIEGMLRKLISHWVGGIIK
jgi:phage gpG-like protein